MTESQDSTIGPLAKNPWLVESVHSFLFLKCPECVFDTEYENEAMFEHHALENHPWSNVLFSDMINVSTIAVENKILDSIKIENHDIFEDSNIANENSILPHMSEIKASSIFQCNEVLSGVKSELAEVEENSTKDRIEQNTNKKGENCDNDTMTVKLVVDIVEHFDIADPSEIQTSDNSMKFSDPLQMLKSGKNKRKVEKPPRNVNKRKNTRQQLKASEAAQTCAQPKKKKVKRVHKIANNTKENKNLQIGIKNPCPICNMSFYDRYWFH